MYRSVVQQAQAPRKEERVEKNYIMRSDEDGSEDEGRM